MAVGDEVDVTCVGPGLDAVDGVLPAAGSAVDDGGSPCLSVGGESNLDSCEDGTPSGDPYGFLCGPVETNLDAQGWSCGKGALLSISSSSATGDGSCYAA
ncbi:MAG: hypothetical protein NT039_01010 [Candidatus Berkelbacteria bacterium]|nr:hypothetical protein [Candidatus Berkelbacteria bacterium]